MAVYTVVSSIITFQCDRHVVENTGSGNPSSTAGTKTGENILVCAALSPNVAKANQENTHSSKLRSGGFGYKQLSPRKAEGAAEAVVVVPCSPEINIPPAITYPERGGGE